MALTWKRDITCVSSYVTNNHRYQVYKCGLRWYVQDYKYKNQVTGDILIYSPGFTTKAQAQAFAEKIHAGEVTAPAGYVLRYASTAAEHEIMKAAAA